MTPGSSQYNHQDSFPLATRLPLRQPDPDTFIGTPAHDPNSSGVKRYSEDDTFDDDDTHNNTVHPFRSIVWQQFIQFMSRTPLIPQSGSGSNKLAYGALPTNHADTEESVPFLNEDPSNPIRNPNEPSAHALQFENSWESIPIPTRATGNGATRRKAVEDDVISVADEATDDDDDPPDNSHYPQVRASVSASDNVAASISTPRMWFLSLLCAFLGSGTNLFFSLRYPSVAVTPVIALVVVHPLGLAWDRLFKRDEDPIEIFEYGIFVEGAADERSMPPLSRLRRWLAQGRWNEKEHACVYISSNVSFGFAFATDVRASHLVYPR